MRVFFPLWNKYLRIVVVYFAKPVWFDWFYWSENMSSGPGGHNKLTHHVIGITVHYKNGDLSTTLHTLDHNHHHDEMDTCYHVGLCVLTGTEPLSTLNVTVKQTFRKWVWREVSQLCTIKWINYLLTLERLSSAQFDMGSSWPRRVIPPSNKNTPTSV